MVRTATSTIERIVDFNFNKTFLLKRHFIFFCLNSQSTFDRHMCSEFSKEIGIFLRPIYSLYLSYNIIFSIIDML